MRPTLILLLALSIASRALANDQIELAQAVPPQPVSFYGYKLDLDGDRLAVGARDTPYAGPGVVYVFERDGSSWTRTAEIQASESVVGDAFGDGVALQGDTLVIGATRRDDLDHDAGAAYVFELVGGTWVERTKLPHASGYNDGFGNAVALDGDTIAVGSVEGECVYVYRGSGSSWVTEAVLNGPGHVAASFGGSLALEGNRLVVGARDEGPSNSHHGAAYVYERTGSTWTLDATLVAAPYLEDDRFGHDVDVRGDRILVSTHHHAYSRGVYVFDRGTTGWRQSAKLEPLTDTLAQYFGESVALSGDIAVVGSRKSDFGPPSAGMIEWYVLGQGGWAHRGRLHASDARANAYLGWPVAIEDRTVVGGAWGNYLRPGAYVFELGCDHERNYCSSAVNSSGSAAVMQATGDHGIEANELTLVARDCPPDTSAVFAYAKHGRVSPMGDGTLCLDPAPPGIFRLLPVLRTDATGRVARPLDFPSLPAAGEISPGTTWYFQCWFRDPAAGGSGTNLSDGLELTFCP